MRLWNAQTSLAVTRLRTLLSYGRRGSSRRLSSIPAASSCWMRSGSQGRSRCRSCTVYVSAVPIVPYRLQRRGRGFQSQAMSYFLGLITPTDTAIRLAILLGCVNRIAPSLTASASPYASSTFLRLTSAISLSTARLCLWMPRLPLSSLRV